MAFKPGEMVTLKTGGFPMVIEAIDDDDGQIYCVWTDEKNKVHRDEFAEVVLKPHQPSSDFSSF